MRRPHVLLSAAAPVPEAKPALYFPAAVGAEREYEWASPARVRTVTEVVTAVEREDGVTYVAFGENGQDGNTGCPHVTTVSGAGRHFSAGVYRRRVRRGKRVKGRKRHVLVGTLGLVFAVAVTPAAASDAAGRRRCSGRSQGTGDWRWCWPTRRTTGTR
jgi:hypothetical protein